ncbi:DUF2627 domain-containing protein [Salipaludibacillus agaradhaerens]|uniref:DUF2627 domain-containing protein n=1 Tax=Salipaludibacillus agaradhaerens TaxID=76935 RepID=UPI002151A676|nr:DUF2627 domain-containing protein [Salipaludibacillus agaradhaerens]MCR6106441.1 DUF2627 domain-containing protein [Salipaludibacillus agaradhaerens]MCR6118474.1 DUF2627 domain-containing protein [Salipaludibacillus agaradhaerens]
MTFQRFIALIILLIPIFTAGYGIKLMRDTLFGQLISPYQTFYVQFFVGIIALAVGIWLIGGFILHRDRKNNKVAPRFQNKKTPS